MLFVCFWFWAMIAYLLNLLFLVYFLQHMSTWGLILHTLILQWAPCSVSSSQHKPEVFFATGAVAAGDGWRKRPPPAATWNWKNWVLQGVETRWEFLVDWGRLGSLRRKPGNFTEIGWILMKFDLCMISCSRSNVNKKNGSLHDIVLVEKKVSGKTECKTREPSVKKILEYWSNHCIHTDAATIATHSSRVGNQTKFPRKSCRELGSVTFWSGPCSTKVTSVLLIHATFPDV